MDKKNRLSSKEKIADGDLISMFWSAPSEARFREEIIAAVVQKSVKTLQCERSKKVGVPFIKAAGRVLYKKEHVVAWLESFTLCDNTIKCHATNN